MDSVQDRLAAGFPHSDIHGSKPARGSPWLFAACHVLHRLSVPRHPPDALLMLDPRRFLLSLSIEQDAIPRAGANPHDDGPASRSDTDPSGPGHPDDGKSRHREDPPGSTVHFTSSHVQDPLPPEDESPAARPRVVRRDVDHGRETQDRFSRRRTKTQSPPVPKDQRDQLVEANGIEPMTSCLQSTRSPN